MADVPAVRKTKRGKAPPHPGRYTTKNSHTSPKQVAREKKKAEALQLRIQAYTFDQIAERMGLPRTVVYRMVTEAIAEIPREAAIEVLGMELKRLDDYQQAIYPNATGGDISSIDASLRVSDRRARLLGLYPDTNRTSIRMTQSQDSSEGDGVNRTLTLEFVLPTKERAAE